MPENFRQLVDLEEGLEEGHLSRVHFGRSRFLRNMGLALFGVSAGLLAVPQEAEAAPYPCQHAPRCPRCRGSRCTARRCRKANACGGNHCWRTAVRARGGCRKIYRCCDWRSRRGLCICRAYLGRVC